MSLIQQVLEAVQENGSVVNLDELSRQVGIQPAALQGILNFCAQKGYLTLDSGGESGCTSCASAAGCPWPSQAVSCYRLKQH